MGKTLTSSLLLISVSLIMAVGCTPSAPEIRDSDQTEILDTSAAARITPEPLSPSQTPAPETTSTPSPSPSPTEIVFEIGKELTIEYLRDLEISGSEITIEERLSPGWNFQRYLASYLSEGNKIYGLLTVPFGDPPEGGFKAVVFNHGYIPPATYQTEERYNAYVNYLAQSGFVVFKIDFRGHGRSEGFPSGSYFSPGYTIDAINALKSLQTLNYVDPEGIGMWGHSMAGNLTLRAMLIEPEVKAGVIWAGAVYSYQDFATYGISDNTYRPPSTPEDQEEGQPLRRSQVIFDVYGRPDLSQPYWQAVALTEHLEYLASPLQIHHAEDDQVVDIDYSYGLAARLQAENKVYEFYIYDGGGHNIISPFFDQAMLRTVAFFEENL
jgi:dipeptidyl aminopeptidase/acylaminoacyl peptidase